MINALHRCAKCGGQVSSAKASTCRKCYGGHDGAQRKDCSVCKTAKPLVAFKPRKQYRYGVSSVCRDCENAARRNAYWKDAEKARNGVRVNRLMAAYGLSPQQYEDLAKSGCHICGSQCKTGRRLAVDHCHKNGTVRGLLCANCNRAIGMLNDDPALVERAAQYLRLRTSRG